METMVTGPSRSTSTVSASVMVCSRDIISGCWFLFRRSKTLSFDYPAGDGLMEIQRAGHGHVGLEIFEAGLLQGAVRRHVEGVRLAEQPFQFQMLEIEVDRAPHAFDADALMPASRLGDMQMHVGLLA